MEAKKSTILLTVVAVATLMVAVVGASFAFFAVQAESNANIEVNTQTSKASDVFNASSTGTISLNVTNDIMREESAAEDNSTVAISDTDSKINVTLEAGSGTATCTYYIKYNDTSVEEYVKTTGATKEYTIQAAGFENDSAKTALNIAETNMDEVTQFGPFTITDSYEASSVPTTQRFDFTARFYNLHIDQEDQLDSKFTGNFVVDEATVSCSNQS